MQSLSLDVCVHICTERACNLWGVINMLGYLFCIFTAPALMVSPEVHAHQGRGAVVFSAGFWRAADGDTLWSDHLEPIWRLLQTKKEGLAVKPQISQTAWWWERQREGEGGRERRKSKKVYNSRWHTSLEDTSPWAKPFMDTQFILWKGCKLHYATYIDTLKQIHWHTCRKSHNLSHANTQTAWGEAVSMGLFFAGYFLCWLVCSLWAAWGWTRHLNTDQSHWLTFSHPLETEGLKHCWAKL